MSSSFLDSADVGVCAGKWSFELTGTRYLTFRDQPQLIKKHVNGTRALDYGCGSGISTAFLKSLGLKVDGVDQCKDMIENAKKEDPTGHYQVIRSGEIPAGDQSYDFVFSNCVFMFVSTKHELVKIFTEMARILKAEGCFIAVVHDETFYNRDDWVTYNTQFEKNVNASSGAPVRMLLKHLGLLMHLYFWTLNDYKEVCDQSGLAIIEIHRPLGRDDDGFQWAREKEMAPFVVLVMKKI